MTASPVASPHTGVIPVLHLLNGEQYSGLERVVDHLAELAPSHGFRLHLVCLRHGEMPDRLKTRQARLHFVNMRNRVDISCIPVIRRIAASEGCQLVHSHTVRSGLIAHALRFVLPLPWIHHVHSPARYESENRCLNYTNYLVERAVLPKATHLLPVSEGLRDYIRTCYGIDDRSITVVRNGVESISLGDPVMRDAAAPKTIGIIGLFGPRKGVEVLLQAFALLVAKGLNARLKLVGGFVDEPYRQSVMQLVDHAGLASRVEFAGHQDNINEQLAALDVFVMPSLYGEGLPMALLEAMAMGCNIVASSIEGPGITEVVDEGNCALLVPPGDPVALADALETAVADDIRNVARATAARERQRALYQVDVMAKAVFDLYSRYLR
ncbi:MAG: glycosyltransferase [Porticoccaceae bacterium]